MAPQPPILLLDNRDSFVWNLAQAFSVLQQDVVVMRSDAMTVDEVVELRPRAIVLSPGPGRPEAAGICITTIRRLSGRTPILGVCLGHQAICVAFGADVVRHAPRHGKPSTIEHTRSGLFEHVPSPFSACRYHSLVVVPESLPDELIADAWSDDGVLMAVHHREHPTFGVQFHPESFRTERGQSLLEAFLEAA